MPSWIWLVIGIGVLNAFFVLALVIDERRSGRFVTENRRQLRIIAWRKGIPPAHEAHQAFQED
jgi:hypothetical protein